MFAKWHLSFFFLSGRAPSSPKPAGKPTIFLSLNAIDFLPTTDLCRTTIPDSFLFIMLNDYFDRSKLGYSPIYYDCFDE